MVHLQESNKRKQRSEPLFENTGTERGNSGAGSLSSGRRIAEKSTITHTKCPSSSILPGELCESQPGTFCRRKQCKEHVYSPVSPMLSIPFLQEEVIYADRRSCQWGVSMIRCRNSFDHQV